MFSRYLVLILLFHLSVLKQTAVNQQTLFHVEDITFPLSTKGSDIVDATGRKVKLAGVNYSGSHLIRECVGGLQCRPLRDIANDIRFKFKMNSIRLTYSLQMIQNKRVPEQYLRANPELKGKTGMEIFDIVVSTLTQVGLMVILNNHNSNSGWCCNLDDHNGLWWNSDYPEEKYFQHLINFSNRYKHNPRVIGIDIRNQLRLTQPSKTIPVLKDPHWGMGLHQTDWKRASKKAADSILKIAPHWLVIVAGLNYQKNLKPLYNDPLKLDIPNKLIYTGHLYSWSFGNQKNGTITNKLFYPKSYEQFKQKVQDRQTKIRQLGVPFIFGQFGNDVITDSYWIWMIRYLKQSNIDWLYWCLDGFQTGHTQDQTYGLFARDYLTIRNPQLLKQINQVGIPPQALAKFAKYTPKDYPRPNQSSLCVGAKLSENKQHDQL